MTPEGRDFSRTLRILHIHYIGIIVIIYKYIGIIYAYVDDEYVARPSSSPPLRHNIYINNNDDDDDDDDNNNVLQKYII